MSQIIKNKTLTKWQMPNIGGPDKEAEAKVEAQKKLLEKMMQDGFQKGYEAGVKEALLKAQSEQSARQILFNALGDNLQQAFAGWYSSLESELVELSCLIAKKVIKSELSLNPLQVVKITQEALAMLPRTAKDVHIKVNPLDAEFFKDFSFEIISDNLVTQGSCIVESEHSRIDASLDKRFDSIRSQLTFSQAGC